MKIKQGLRYLEYALTLLLFVLAAYSVVVYASGAPPFYVVSDHPSSMSPTMNYGTVGVVYRTPFQNLRVGDIVVYHDPDNYAIMIVHRIVAIVPCGDENHCLQTKGDNNKTNPTKDGWNVTQADYQGQVILIIPYIGYLSPSFWGFEGAEVAIPLVFVFFFVLFIMYARPQKQSKNSERTNSNSVSNEQTEDPHEPRSPK